VWCSLWGTDWILKYYLDELRLQRVNYVCNVAVKRPTFTLEWVCIRWPKKKTKIWSALYCTYVSTTVTHTTKENKKGELRTKPSKIKLPIFGRCERRFISWGQEKRASRSQKVPRHCPLVLLIRTRVERYVATKYLRQRRRNFHFHEWWNGNLES
jgi:hypothetical protein